MARALLLCLAALCLALPLAGGAAIFALYGPEALLRLSPSELAVVAMGLFFPSALTFLGLGYMTQRRELSLLRGGLAGNTDALMAQQRQLAALAEEARTQNEIMREQVRLAIEGLRGDRRRAETQAAHFTETRLVRLTAEWDLVARELTSLLAAMFRRAHGTERVIGAPGDDVPELRPVPMPSGDDLPLAILRLLPRTPEEALGLDVDEGFLRLAGRYRDGFNGFLARVPETGPVNRAFFRSMVHGRLEERLALLPRPEDREMVLEIAAAAE